METEDDAAIDLLLQAVEAMPPEERSTVLKFLLKRGMTAPPMQFVGGSSGSSIVGNTGFVTNPRRTPGGDDSKQMLALRFTADSHQRLRSWCGDNGFPMAAVVRGLVDQFLDEQGATTPS